MAVLLDAQERAAAKRIADVIIERGYTNPFGGDVSRSTNAKGKTRYVTDFSLPAVLDGTVEVFSSGFILVRARGKRAPFGDFSAVYGSVDDAIEAAQQR